MSHPLGRKPNQICILFSGAWRAALQWLIRQCLFSLPAPAEGHDVSSSCFWGAPRSEAGSWLISTLVLGDPATYLPGRKKRAVQLLSGGWGPCPKQMQDNPVTNGFRAPWLITWEAVKTATGTSTRHARVSGFASYL